MSEVSTFVSANFSQPVTIVGLTNAATENTLNYRWIPDASSTYTWESSGQNVSGTFQNVVDTVFRLYSSNIQKYPNSIRTFDNIPYGFVMLNDDITAGIGGVTMSVFSKIVVQGDAHINETLIIAVGLINNDSNKTFNLSANTPGVWLQSNSPPISNICFPAGTHITTNQGTFPIEKINTKIHTIRNKKIVGITQTITQDKYLVCFEKDSLGINLPSQKTIISKNHCIFYKGKMMQSKEFISKFENVKKIKYNGEILYNVLMEEDDKMMVNNLICQTLHPENSIAKLYKYLQNVNPKEKQKIIEEYNEYAIKNKVFSSKNN
jgi:hypothetical protein